MGARGLLYLGLPALGAALAGTPGLVAGLLASAARVLLSKPRPGLKQTLIAVGLGAALGATGLVLGPAVGAGLALATLVVPAALAGVAAARKDATVTIQPEAFAKKYVGRVNQALMQAKPEDEFELIAPARGAGQKACADAVLKAFQLAATNLPSGAALALAGESARELLSPNDLQRFDQALLRAVSRKSEILEGQQELAGEVKLQKIRTKGSSPALAANQIVLIDEGFSQKSDAATVDFVVGHELSHVRHKDAAFKQGVSTLQEMLTLACAPGNVALDLTKYILRGMMASESKSMELRADREGFEYAQGRGHSAQALRQAADKLFANAPKEGDLFGSHPPGPERVKALEHLE